MSGLRLLPSAYCAIAANRTFVGGELPAEVSVMAFLGRTVNVKDGLRGSIDKSSCLSV